MKRKIFVFILAALSTLALAFGLSACDGCNGDDGANGTYYLYANGNYDKSQYITLSGKNWSDDDGANGTFTLNGEKIVFYAEVFGSNEEMYDGTLSGGVLTISVLGSTMTYCKEGVTPPQSNAGTDTPKPPKPATKYNITYNANGGLFSDGEKILSQTATEGDILTAPASPARMAYAFGGWATDANGKNVWKFASDTVDGDLTLYAIWQEQSAAILSADGATINEKEMSVFMLVKNNTDSVSLSNKIVCSSDSVWKLYYDKLGQTEIPTKIAAGKLGELSNGDNIFYIVVTSSNGSQVNVYELNVHRSYEITISYYDNKNALINTDTTYSGYEYSVDYSPSIAGYTFNHWKDEKGAQVASLTPYAPAKFYADCTVNTYTATLDVNGGNDLTKTEYTVTYDENYSLPVPARTGYSFLGWYYSYGELCTDNSGNSIENWTNTRDTKLVASWRANDYKLTLKTSASSAGTVTGDGDYAYDSSVTIRANTNNGYTWLGWYDNNDELLTDNTSYTFKMGLTTAYTAKWIVCPVTIEKSISAAGTVSYTTKTVAGEEYTVTAKTNNGYTWLGWYNGDERLTTELSYKYKMPSSSSESKTFTAKWTYYTLTTAVNDSKAGLVTEYNETKITAGNSITLTATTNLGYTFLGWYNGETELTKDLSLTFDMPIENLTYTAKWTYYTLTTAVSDSEAGTVSAYSDTKVTAGDNVTLTATTKTGYTWLGWFNGETELTKEFSYTFAMPAENVIYTAKWTYYTVTTYQNDNNAGTITNYNETKTTFDNKVTVTAITNVGYTWLGWYNGETKLTDELSYSFTMPTENITYTAKWEIWSELSNFSFTSTSTTCSIKGIKDKSVTEITVPDYVTSISGGAFSGCGKLENITLPFVGGSIKTSSDRYQYPFGYIFGTSSYTGGTKTTQYYYGSSTVNSTDTDYYIPATLKQVTVTGGNILRGAFYNCSGLTSITIPDSETSIGDYAFIGCSGLTSITIPDSVTSIGESTFRGCSGITSVTIGNSVTSIGNDAFENTAWFNNQPDGLVYAGKVAYKYKGTMPENTSITLADGTKGIVGSAFEDCSGLTSITIPDSVTYIGSYAFEGCLIENATIPAFAASYIKNSNLKTVIITSGTSIGDYAFYNCSGLTSITIPDSVTEIGYQAFYNCSGLTSITIPDSVTSIGNLAFYGCSGLTSITIPDSVTSIGAGAFSDCSWLMFITVGENNINYKSEKNCLLSKDGKTLIIGCKTSIIPDSVTEIGSHAFLGCDNLKSITIPDSVTEIGSHAFSGCYGLTSVTFEKTSGWRVFTSSTATSGTSVTVTNSKTVITYLTDTYCFYYWKR